MSDAIEAWGSVASAYRRYWTPRFAPFVREALDAFQPGRGPLVVVGCGPGDEARALAERFGERELYATDPARAMVALAREGLADRPRARVAVATARESVAPLAPVGGVFSSFVLQLLPDREAALSAWRDGLAPDGVVVALFWPRQPDDSPWGRMGRAALAVSGKPRPEWEQPLRARLRALGLELTVARDVRHEIVHASPEEAWRALRDACSYQVFLRRMGAERTAAVESAWLADHGLREREDGWAHEAVARLWVLRRST